MQQAVQNYACVLEKQPVFRTDVIRIIYSLIRLYGITDHMRFNVLKQVFEILFGHNATFKQMFEKAITDYNIKLISDIVSNDLPYYVKILDDPSFIESKQILWYLVKLADAYFDETYATRIRRVMEECSRGQKTEKITNIQQGIRQKDGGQVSNDEVNPNHRGRG